MVPMTNKLKHLSLQITKHLKKTKKTMQGKNVILAEKWHHFIFYVIRDD